MSADDRSRATFVWACTLDVATRKPGNVSVAAPGHGMQAAMFVDSARAAAPALFARGERVGTRIEAAMRASFAAAGCNTNLGIVLLAAPLAVAFERVEATSGATALRGALAGALDELDVHDARAAFGAIAAVNPGGLGRVDRHDVVQPASTTLLEAMRLAADRDRVAYQYATAYEDVFERGLPWFADGLARARDMRLDAGAAARHAMLGVYLELLARDPDSHIARRHGEAIAQSVTAQTLSHVEAWRRGDLREHSVALARWDAKLKRARLNPGTTADLGVTVALVAAWLNPLLAA